LENKKTTKLLKYIIKERLFFNTRFFIYFDF